MCAKSSKFVLITAIFSIFLGTALAVTPEAAPNSLTKAIAVLIPTKDNTVTGTITFTQLADGIKISGDFQNLTPGQHGFHIHEYGDCSSPDGMAAGGHYNPTHMPHAGTTTDQRHEGDMGNLTADATGKAHYEFVDKLLSLQDNDSIIGRSLIVHANADDLTSQPAGNSGPRVACGVIGVAK